MSAFVRLKRKRNDEPTETLLLSTKRSKQESLANGGFQRELYRFAGTVDNPAENSTVLSSVVQAQLSNKHSELSSKNAKSERPINQATGAFNSKRRRIQLVQVNDSIDEQSSSAASISRPVRVYDAVLNDVSWPAAPQLDVDDNTTDIACNGEVMTKVITQTKATESDDDYVYDIFYLDGEAAGFDHTELENMLCLEAFGEDYAVFNEYRDDTHIYEDDDDDSNDEDNWRNDYPDEDALLESQASLNSSTMDSSFQNTFSNTDSSDENEYRPDDDGMPDFTGIRIASDEDDVLSASDDDDLEGFGDMNPEFRRYYRSYKRSVQSRCHDDFYRCDDSDSSCS